MSCKNNYFLKVVSAKEQVLLSLKSLRLYDIKIQPSFEKRYLHDSLID